MLPYPEEIGDTVGVYYLVLLPSIFTVRNEVAKVIFYRCVSVHRGLLSQHALQQVSRWGLGIPACLAGFQAHSQGGSLGICPVGRSPGPHSRWKLGGVRSRSTAKGEVEGIQSRPTLKGEVGGVWSRSTAKGEVEGIQSRPTLQGEVEGDQVMAHSQGGKLREIESRPTAKGEVEGDQPHPPPQQTATVANGTHPTGIHSFATYFG